MTHRMSLCLTSSVIRKGKGCGLSRCANLIFRRDFQGSRVIFRQAESFATNGRRRALCEARSVDFQLNLALGPPQRVLPRAFGVAQIYRDNEIYSSKTFSVDDLA